MTFTDKASRRHYWKIVRGNNAFSVGRRASIKPAFVETCEGK